MSLVALALLFLAGALVANAIPHLASGTRGELFPTPFARPHGVGLSSPVTNVLWGTANLFAGLAILDHFALNVALPAGRIAVAIGFLLSALFAAIHFGKVRASR